MLRTAVTARPHPRLPRRRGGAVPVNRDEDTSPSLGTSGRRLGCADIESETELSDLEERLVRVVEAAPAHLAGKGRVDDAQGDACWKPWR